MATNERVDNRAVCGAGWPPSRLSGSRVTDVEVVIYEHNSSTSKISGQAYSANSEHTSGSPVGPGQARGPRPNCGMISTSIPSGP